ncbi:MAG: hypothetical protein GX260_08725 [Tissierellia bacterium]|nr:hypothetical protein [Tissierellia bacterium]
MRLGIKYCGGCNNQYDRLAFLEKIKKTFPHMMYEYVDESEIYDVVVFLQGCHRKCASRNYRANRGFFDVEPSNLDTAIEELRELFDE